VAAANEPAGLIDTDILIDAARGRREAVAFLDGQRASSRMQISIISAMELTAGSRDKVELAQVQEFLASVIVLPISEAISQKALGLMENFFLSHGLLIPDALIAATALEHALDLYTKNTRHFQMIPGLGLSRPY